MANSRDIGTPELHKRRKVLPRLKPLSGYGYELWVADGSEPDRLLLEGAIDIKEHGTLLTFMVMLHKAKMLGIKGPSFEKGSATDPSYVAEKMANAIGRVGSVIKELDNKIGRNNRMLLVSVCTSNTQIPSEFHGSVKQGVGALRECLDSLETHNV